MSTRVLANEHRHRVLGLENAHTHTHSMRFTNAVGTLVISFPFMPGNTAVLGRGNHSFMN